MGKEMHPFGGSPLGRPMSSEALERDGGVKRLGAPLGIPLFVGYTVLVLLVMFIVRYATLFQTDIAMASGLMLVGTILLFLSIVMHEYGHGLTSRRFGAPCTAIVIDGFGGVAYCGRMRASLRRIAVSAAGPATHLLWMAPAGVALAAGGKFDGMFAVFTPGGKSLAFLWNVIGDVWMWQLMCLLINAIPWLPGNDASHIVQTCLDMKDVRPRTKIYHVSWGVNALVTITGVILYWQLGGTLDRSLLWMLMLLIWFGYNEYQVYTQVESEPPPFEPLYRAPTEAPPRAGDRGPPVRTTVKDGVIVAV